MGRQNKVLVSCDGSGCDVVFEGLATDYCPIQQIKLAMNGGAAWAGYLCGHCEKKLAAIVRAPFGQETKNGNQPLPFPREDLGRMVREAWVRWAREQPAPKPSWLVPYDDLAEPDKEADRQIGESIARWTLIGDSARGVLTETEFQEWVQALPAEREAERAAATLSSDHREKS